MKYLAFILFLIFSLQLVYAQEAIDSKQFIIGIKNVLSTDEVDHTIEPIGTYWEINITTQIWSISTDPLGESSTITTTGNSNFDPDGMIAWPGWNFFWLNNTQPEDEDWGLGFYKVTNDFNDNFVYVDGRDNRFAQVLPPYTNPDFFVHLDADNELYYHANTAGEPTWIETSKFEIIRIWDIHEVNPPYSNSLPGYWDNVLVPLDGGDGHPRIAWGPYNNNTYVVQNFKVYRKICACSTPTSLANFTLAATLNNDVWEWVDSGF